MVAEQFNEVNIFYREIVRNNNSDYQSSTGCAEENPNINKAKGSEAEDLSPSPTNIDAEGGDHEVTVDFPSFANQYADENSMLFGGSDLLHRAAYSKWKVCFYATYNIIGYFVLVLVGRLSNQWQMECMFLCYLQGLIVA